MCQKERNEEYWDLVVVVPETPQLRGLRHLYQTYCRQVWQTVDTAIAQAIGNLPPELQECLHYSLTYQERKALKSDVLWRLIERAGVPVDLEIDSLEVSSQRELVRALVTVQAIQKSLKQQRE